MAKTTQEDRRYEAQEHVWNAMDLLGRENDRAKTLCQQAVAIYPDCVDALILLAQLEDRILMIDYIARMREAVDAGRRDLGSDWFKHQRGMFWGFHETRPFMRAMAALSDALLEWGTNEGVDEAIVIYEEMLDLNPNDNQGVRDTLGACYLQRKRYDEAAALFKQYENDGMANALWSRVVLAHATGEVNQAKVLLEEARYGNSHVELFFTGRKRRPRQRPGYYSPGDISEAIYCADTLWEVLKKHPKTKAWIKEQCS